MANPNNKIKTKSQAHELTYFNGKKKIVKWELYNNKDQIRFLKY